MFVTRDNILYLLRKGEDLAYTAISSRLGYVFCVGVYPLDTSDKDVIRRLRRHGFCRVKKITSTVYYVRKFEIKRELVDQWVDEKELDEKDQCFATSEDGLEICLDRFGVCLEQLTWPCDTDYPI